MLVFDHSQLKELALARLRHARMWQAVQNGIRVFAFVMAAFFVYILVGFFESFVFWQKIWAGVFLWFLFALLLNYIMRIQLKKIWEEPRRKHLEEQFGQARTGLKKVIRCYADDIHGTHDDAIPEMQSALDEIDQGREWVQEELTAAQQFEMEQSSQQRKRTLH